MRVLLKSAVLAAGIMAVAGSFAAAQEQQNPADVARFYAGLSVPADSTIGKFAEAKAWQAYAKAFDASWEKIDARQLVKVRAWQAANVKGA